MKPMNNSAILAFDFLDPWGWIAIRRLESAVRLTKRECRITFLPFQSLLGRTFIAKPYAQYLQRRLGTDASAWQASVSSALRGLGIEPALDRVGAVADMRPVMADLLELQRSGQPAQALVESVYQAIYCQGADMNAWQPVAGAPRLATSAAQDNPALDAVRLQVQAWAGRVIPSMRINGRVVYGAQPAEVLVPLLA
jgi:2-hydroxychromene-2-carboxylate isomerase